MGELKTLKDFGLIKDAAIPEEHNGGGFKWN